MEALPLCPLGFAPRRFRVCPETPGPVCVHNGGDGVPFARPRRSSVMANDRQPSVLIVDDHDGFRSFARKLLEAAGFTVTEAASGTEAMTVADRVRPMLVLLDIGLPDIDGFEVARQLVPAHQKGPIVVLTSTREASDYGAQVAISPAVGFLPKEQLSGVALRSYLAGYR
jgi:CheY-like chemotaxis protein